MLIILIFLNRHVTTSHEKRQEKIFLLRNNGEGYLLCFVLETKYIEDSCSNSSVHSKISSIETPQYNTCEKSHMLLPRNLIMKEATEWKAKFEKGEMYYKILIKYNYVLHNFYHFMTFYYLVSLVYISFLLPFHIFIINKVISKRF